MDDFALCDHLWQLVVDQFYAGGESEEDPPCNYPESLFAAGLPLHWWTAYGVHAFEYDVLSGGIRQFLDNHNGLTNDKTSEAFRTIGYPDLADAFDVVGSAYIAFSKARFPEDRELTDEEYVRADSDLDAEMLKEGQEFERIHKCLDLRGALANYIRSNMNLFTD
jgi:hypothetical protein